MCVHNRTHLRASALKMEACGDLCVCVWLPWRSVYRSFSKGEREGGGSRGADLGDGRVEDVADVARRRLVPLPQGQRVGVQPPLDGLGLGPGQSGQQHGFVYILAVLADEVGQPGVLQPLLLLLAL